MAQPAPGAPPVHTPVADAVTGAPPAPSHALSLSLPALSTRSLAAAYEHARFFGDERFSLLGLAGLRRGATGDYSSTTVSAAVELRYWLTGRAPWSPYATRAMVGAFAGLRLGLASTTTYDEIDDERIGNTLTLSEVLQLGYRFIAWQRMEITPSIGLQLRHEIELASRLPPWTRGAMTVGLSVGWVF